jgi:hypothetical protein
MSVQKIGWSPVPYAKVQARQAKEIRENDAQTVMDPEECALPLKRGN